LGKESAAVPQIRVGSPVEEEAKSVRRLLNVSTEQQRAWESASQALKSWRGALENLGVFVFLMPLGRKSVRGFSLWDGYAPLVAVNTWWIQEARIFTVFHECAHLLTRTNSACATTSPRVLPAQQDQVERWCEEFAACVLLPWEPVSECITEWFSWRPGRVLTSLDQIRKLAREFKVSLRAATLRLIGKGAATWELYSEIPPWSDEKRGGRATRGRTRIEAREDVYGRKAIAVFLSAIREEIFNPADALDHLNVSYSELERLDRQLE
jgi:Zn-dependent peptidase ImmA (M78 family)